MKPKGDIKTTLRYKNMVANLRSRPAYYKEAELLREIAGGKQWRIDAVMDAIDARPGDWQKVSLSDIMKSAAMFGRLSTVENLHAILQRPENVGDSRIAPAINDALHTAVTYGHFRVADYLLGAGAKLGTHPDNARNCYVEAIREGGVRKVDYLLSKGADYSALLTLATVSDGGFELAKHLMSKKAPSSADVAELFVRAAINGDDRLFREAMKKEVDLEASAGRLSEALYFATAKNRPHMVKALIDKGVPAEPQLLADALQLGRTDVATILLVKGVNPNAGYGQNALIAAASSVNPQEQIALCLKYGADMNIAIDLLRQPRALRDQGFGHRQALETLETHALMNRQPPVPKGPSL